LQRTIGNQAVLRLFESGMAQTKLRVSQPGDADEQQADRVADQIVSAKHQPVLQRKCACSGGAACSKCAQEQEDELIHRSAVGPLHPSPFSIQRAAVGEADHSATTSGAAAQHNAAKRPGERPHVVIVEDDAPSVAPGQMRKTRFVALLQTSTCATADAVLASVGHTTKGCPYIKKWLDHYKDKDAHHLTRAMNKYAPETVRARSAHEAIALVNHRVQRAALSWAKTGKVSDLPEGIQEEMTGGGGLLGAAAGFASSGFGSALLGFLGGGKKESAAGAETGGGVRRKSREGAAAGEHDAAKVREQLGSGHSLDGRVQSQMSSAFGYDFSGVRVHTDSRSAGLSADLNARAFTIGSDVAFAAGEYQPGTLIGDALIAHELAHVVQQGGGQQADGAQIKDAGLGNESGLEQDADRSAVGAVVSLWMGTGKGLAEIGANALPRLKSGLKLQRCANCNKQVVKPAPPQQTPATPPPAAPQTGEPKGLGQIVEDIGVAFCDPDLGRMTWRPVNYEHIPICAADCVRAHEEAHVRFGQEQCAKASALYKAAQEALKKFESSHSEADAQALRKALDAAKKAVDKYAQWKDDTCKENEGQAYQAGIDKCMTPEIQKQCTDLGETEKLKKFIEQQKKFRKSPPNCEQKSK
jgi:hypothetical protein